MTEKIKICTFCKNEFPATLEYFFSEKKGKYGLRSLCKSCFAIKAKKLKSLPTYREKAREYCKKHYYENRKWYAKKWQKYYKENSDVLKARAIIYAKNNLQRSRELNTIRRKDPQFRLSLNISRMMRYSLKNNRNKGGRHWGELVGYTIEQLKKHLEKQFQPGMTWENYGDWHIDHKTPMSVFNFTNPKHDDFKRCWALNNLQPLWAIENMSKSNKLSKHFQPMLAMG